MKLAQAGVILQGLKSHRWDTNVKLAGSFTVKKKLAGSRTILNNKVRPKFIEPKSFIRSQPATG